MLSTPAEIVRRTRGRLTGRLHSLPILALHVHTACNCRCVMCDIWKANHARREIGIADLERHVAAIRALRVSRVMLTGGEPLLHSNLWALCDRLRAEGIRLTLVTTGLLIEKHADAIRRAIDEVVVSIDGPPEVHDRIRRVPGGSDRIARGLQALRAQDGKRFRVIARAVVQQGNYAALAETVEHVAAMPVDRLSFLAADVFSSAFNRPTPWDEERRREVAVSAEDLPRFADAIAHTVARCRRQFDAGFVLGGIDSLRRIHQYYRALNGLDAFPVVRCRAPWTSAVLEADGAVRPCFFHASYPTADGLAATLNSTEAIRFRQQLDVSRDDTCRRCVCSLRLPVTRQP